MECLKYVIKWKNKNYRLILTPYKPFANPTIDSYYVISNKMYHSLKRCDEHIDLKKALYDLGVCDIGRNTLCYNKEYGSRFYIGVEETEEKPMKKIAREKLCNGCNACADACPTGAILENGFLKSKCLRFQMESGKYDDERLAGGRVLGCDICQRVCPLNREEYVENYEEFSLKNLKLALDNNDLGNLKKLIGSNMARRAKLSYLVGVAIKNTSCKEAENE